MKKTTAILLITVLLCTVTGCGAKEPVLPSEPPIQSEGPEESPDGALPGSLPNKNALAGDTLMMTVDGIEVTWDEYYPWLLYSKASFEENYGEIADYSAEAYSGMTYSDFILENAAGMLRYYTAIEKNAVGGGLSLTDEERKQLADRIVQDAASYESEEEYSQQMELVYGGREHYEHMLEISMLYSKCFIEQFGETGEKLSDEDVLEHTADDGYMMAKHILLRTTDDSSEPLSDEEKTKRYSQMEGFLAELDAGSDATSMEAKFDQLMNEHSEDPGLASYPDGYLFQPGQMAEEFEKATLDLAEQEHSGIVETQHGYHIILRMPINVEVIPMAFQQYMQYGIPYSLRYATAEAMLTEIVFGWSENVSLETAEAYDMLDLSEVFI